MGLCIKERADLVGKAKVDDVVRTDGVSIDGQHIVREEEVRDGGNDVTKAVGKVAGMAGEESSVVELVVSPIPNVVVAGKQSGDMSDVDSGKGLEHLDREMMRSNEDFLMGAVVNTRAVEGKVMGSQVRDCIAPAVFELDLSTIGEQRKVVKGSTGTWKRRARSTEHTEQEVDASGLGTKRMLEDSMVVEVVGSGKKSRQVDAFILAPIAANPDSQGRRAQ